MSDGRPKIILGEADFDDGPSATTMPPPAAGPAVPTPPSQPKVSTVPDSGLPPVARRPPVNLGSSAGDGSRGVAAGQTELRWLTDPRTAPLVAAGVGVLVAWAVTQATGVADIHVTTAVGSDATSAAWTGLIGVILGGALLVFDRAVAGAWDAAARRFVRAAPPMFAIAFVSGFIGNAVYLHIVDAIFANASIFNLPSANNAGFYLARALGWALFGGGIGATIGILDKSRARAINGGIGGALGGAVGGLVFQFVAANLGTSNSISRLLGLIGVGALIALAIRVVETTRREAWLQILAGGMAGKEFILYHPTTHIGASAECEIFLLKDPAVAKLHAEIEDRGTERVLSAVGGSPVLVNQTPVTVYTLRTGDQIQIGNTLIGYSERAIAPSPARSN